MLKAAEPLGTCTLNSLVQVGGGNGPFYTILPRCGSAAAVLITNFLTISHAYEGSHTPEIQKGSAGEN